MFRTIALIAASALVLGSPVLAETAHQEIEDVSFAHEGPFGTFDQFQLQRGLQVYTEVCAACHGLKFVPIRSLSDAGGPGLPEDQVRAYAKAFTVYDEESNRAVLWDSVKSEMRPLKDSDNFPINNTMGAPDLSLMAKARAGFHGPYGTGISQLFNGMGGPEYIVSILNGYADNPECAPEGMDGLYYNTAFGPGGYPDSCKIFEETKTVVTQDDGTTVEKIEKKEVGRIVPGSWIRMSPPLSDGQVEYADGHDTSAHHMSEDVASFLMWAAEPQMMARKWSGFVGVGLLGLLTTLLYLTNKRLWAGIKGKKTA